MNELVSKKKRRRVRFSENLENINLIVHTNIRRIRNDLIWYKKDEIESFTNDAKMISRAFAVQKIRRSRNNIISSLVPSKTVCAIGLELSMNDKRQIEKASTIRMVLNAQKKLKKVVSSQKLESILATVIIGASFNAKRIALEDGQSVSKQTNHHYFANVRKANAQNVCFTSPLISDNINDAANKIVPTRNVSNYLRKDTSNADTPTNEEPSKMQRVCKFSTTA